MDNNSHSSKNFFNGLLVGAIIGAGAVFLLGTDKGKKVLKAITDESLQGFSEIEDFIDDVRKSEPYDTYEDDETDDIPFKPTPKENPQESTYKEVAKDTKPVHTAAKTNGHKSTIHKISSTTRRFFRGTPKKP